MSRLQFNNAVIDGDLVKSASCRIISSPSLDYMANLHRGTELRILPEPYILKNPIRPVTYHPKQACHKLLNLCCYVDKYGWTDDTHEVLAKLVGEIESHIREDRGNVFVTYPLHTIISTVFQINNDHFIIENFRRNLGMIRLQASFAEHDSTPPRAAVATNPYQI